MCVDELPQRHREIEGSPADRTDLALEARAREERREQVSGDIWQGFALEVAGAEARQILGHVEAAVGRKSAHYRVDEADGFSATCSGIAFEGTRCAAQPRCPPSMLRRNRSVKMPAAVTAGRRQAAMINGCRSSGPSELRCFGQADVHERVRGRKAAQTHGALRARTSISAT